jgi:hypothetical protein
MCAVPDADIVHIAPSPIQSFVPGYKHGVMSWFTFDGEAGTTYIIESHNEGTLHLYDASLMSTSDYRPADAMLAGMENSHLVASSTPYQQIQWVCSATGMYAVAVSQSLWDCNNGCGTVDLSVTRTTAEEADTQIIEVVPNTAMMFGTACVFDMLVTCHYRQLQGSQDLGWANGDGGRQFVLSLDGHAGQTFHFRVESMSDVAVAEMISRPWWETVADTKGNSYRPGDARPQMRLGGPTDSISARFTLYPPAAVGGARRAGWENHELTIGGPTTSDSFTWTCPSAGTWLLVVEATCPLDTDRHDAQQCSSGFTLTTTSADESTNSLTCTGSHGAEVCSGPTVQLTLEVDAQSEAMLQAHQADLLDLHQVAPITTGATEEEAQAASMLHLQQATTAQIFEIAQPPALVFVRDVAPSASPPVPPPLATATQAPGTVQYIDATVEIRAANSDVSQSVGDCLRSPGLVAVPVTEGTAAFGSMFNSVRECAQLNPIIQSNQVTAVVYSAPCTNPAELAAWASALTDSCCGGPSEPLCRHGTPSACLGDCSSTVQGFQGACMGLLRAASNVEVEGLVSAASAVCANGAGPGTRDQTCECGRCVSACRCGSSSHTAACQACCGGHR